MQKSDVLAVVTRERRQLADDVSAAPAQAWSRPTDCADWDAHDVLAHLVEVAKSTRAGFLRDMVAAGFDFDVANERAMCRERRDDPAKTLAEFRAVAHRTTGPPAPVGTRLVEIFVHGEDLRRAIGVTYDYPSDDVGEALRYQAGASASVGGSRDVVQGLRLVATDTDLCIGAGSEVRGSAMSLLLAVTGRPVAADALSGPGAARLQGPGLMPWSTSQLWEAVHRERSALADDLAQLDADQWAHPSLCSDWSVQDVVAHLSAAASTGRLAWLRSVLAARFDFDKHNQRRLAEQRGMSPAETLARFHALRSSTTAASGHIAAWLGEVVVHAHDIRRPLGLPSDPDVGALTQVARFFAGRDFAVKSRSTMADLRLEATDGPFAAGEGQQVTGPTLALIMAMAGRAAYLDDLSGDGLRVLRQRLA